MGARCDRVRSISCTLIMGTRTGGRRTTSGLALDLCIIRGPNTGLGILTEALVISEMRAATGVVRIPRVTAKVMDGRIHERHLRSLPAQCQPFVGCICPERLP